jgi:hypothetical protein
VTEVPEAAAEMADAPAADAPEVTEAPEVVAEAVDAPGGDAADLEASDDAETATGEDPSVTP